MTELPRTPSMNLSGKLALVTGASSGIGQGCAVALAEAGAHVICAARGRERLEETVDALRKNGWRAEIAPLDQADLGAIEALIDTYAFDIIVNSAGLARHGPALETTPEDYDAVADLNLRSAYFLSTYAAESVRVDQSLDGSQIGLVERRDFGPPSVLSEGVNGFFKAFA
ncbi:MAG: SDR family NAD(P)-dependent oxidoreductase, partial [Pseudomonadota bacterium]